MKTPLRTILIPIIALLFSAPFAGAERNVCVDSILYDISGNSATVVGTLKPHIEIPKKIIYKNIEYSVNSITGMSNDTTLRSIILPDYIHVIGGYDFMIYDYCFYNCKSLESIVIPEKCYTYIGEGAFFGCTSLKNFTATSEVFNLPDNVFRNCLSMDTLTIEKSYKECSFSGPCRQLLNSGIHTLVIGRDIICSTYNKIYPFSIYGPGEIKNIVILDDTECPTFFSNCFFKNKIETMTIGKNVSPYPESCSDWSINKLILEDPVPPECPEFTDEQYRTLIVNVPDESLDDYRNADGWKNFLCLYSSDIDQPAIATVKTETARYNLQGRPVSRDYSGLVIVRYSDGSSKKILVK